MTLTPWQDGDAGFLSASGVALEFQVWGPPPNDAMTLVLLHDGLGCVATWRDFPQALAKATGCGVLVYSRAGYGRSDAAVLPRPLDYMTREAADVLPEVLNAAGIKRALLLGHSDGGTIAAINAGSVFDPRVRGLVLIAPHFFTEPMGLAAIRAAREGFANFREKLGRYHDNPDATFAGWADAWLDPGFEDWDVAEVIDTIRVPVLAIQGAADQYGTLAQIEVIDERCYAPVETEILAACGHSPHRDQPAKVIGLVADFVARLERIERAGP